ncbi:MAG: universal stress protein [Ornithinimicrobium sp.]
MDPSASERPIVVGYDASDCAAIALEWAGNFAHALGSPVRVLHSAATLVRAQGLAYGQISAATEQDYAEQIATDGLRRLLARHPDLSVDTSTSLLGPTLALDEASASASFIVVGSHGRGRFGAVMLGSTAYAVSGHARCPVVVVRGEHAPLPDQDRPIVVGSDGSVGSERAVEAAAHLAANCAAPLIVVTTWVPPAPDPWDRPPLGYSNVAECLKDLHQQAEATNEAAIQRIRQTHPQLDVVGSVREIRPDDGLLQTSAQASLIVLGSRGHGSLLGTILGSTARSVLHRTQSPVMVVH